MERDTWLSDLLPVNPTISYGFRNRTGWCDSLNYKFGAHTLKWKYIVYIINIDIIIIIIIIIYYYYIIIYYIIIHYIIIHLLGGRNEGWSKEDKGMCLRVGAR